MTEALIATYDLPAVPVQNRPENITPSRQWRMLVNEVLERLRTTKSDNTVKAYRTAYEDFHFNGLPSYDGLVKATRYFKEVRGLSNKTIIQKYSALRYILENYRELFDEQEVQKMLRFMRETKKEHVVVPTATPKQVETFLNSDIPETTKVVVALAYYAGLRIEEIQRIDVQHFYLKDNDLYLKVVLSKGNKEREVPIHDKLREIITTYIQRYRTGSFDPALVISSRRTRLSIRHMSRIVKEASDKLGVDLTCHSFRHGIATELNRKGVGIRTIQALLGHSSIATTQHYIKIDATDIKKGLDIIE